MDDLEDDNDDQIEAEREQIENNRETLDEQLEENEEELEEIADGTDEQEETITSVIGVESDMIEEAIEDWEEVID